MVYLHDRIRQSDEFPSPIRTVITTFTRKSVNRDPLLKMTREPCKVEEKRPVLRRSIHVLFTKKLSKPIERGNPLLKHTHTDNVPDGSQTRSCHESISFNVGDETICDRTGQPVVNSDESSHEQTMLNEVNMDFRIQDCHILL